MDYSNNFSGNKSPDEFLYNFLTDLYGSVDGSRAPNITKSGDGGTTANQSPGSRRLRNYRNFGQHRDRRLFSSVANDSRREYLENRWNAINVLVSNGFKKSDREQWRLLHRTEFGEAHEIDLDEEYKVRVHLLLA